MFTRYLAGLVLRSITVGSEAECLWILSKFVTMHVFVRFEALPRACHCTEQ
jgi:hypothetical protein